MEELGTLGALLFFAILILALLLPLFVFLIYTEALKTNRLLKSLVDLTVDPEIQKKNHAEVMELQNKMRQRRW